LMAPFRFLVVYGLRAGPNQVAWFSRAPLHQRLHRLHPVNIWFYLIVMRMHRRHVISMLQHLVQDRLLVYSKC